MASSAYSLTSGGTGDVRDARRIGAKHGFRVALGFVVVGGLVLAQGDSATAARTFGELAIPTLIAGTLGGRQLGPRAMRARTRRNWLAVIVSLSVVAMIIGGACTGAALAVQSIADNPVPPVEAIGQVLALAGAGATFGLIFFGPAALIFVLPAAWFMGNSPIHRR
jgi:hypothetical protein